jgi:hypothetical protein
MAKTIDEDLAQLDKDIRQLKIEYEQYFGGGKARPPSDIEWRIDSLLKRHSDRGAEMNYTQRFRYGNLTQMYSKLSRSVLVNAPLSPKPVLLQSFLLLFPVPIPTVKKTRLSSSTPHSAARKSRPAKPTKN